MPAGTGQRSRWTSRADGMGVFFAKLLKCLGVYGGRRLLGRNLSRGRTDRVVTSLEHVGKVFPTRQALGQGSHPKLERARFAVLKR